MRIYLNKHQALLLETIDLTDEEVEAGIDVQDFTVRLAGEIVDIGRKLEIVQELRDACNFFLELESQKMMKEQP